MPEPSPVASTSKGPPALFFVIIGAALISLGGGATLLFLSQTGSLGSASASGPGLLSAEYAAGQAVNIWEHEHWLPGKVQQKKDETYLVALDASPTQTQWVDASRLQARRAQDD